MTLLPLPDPLTENALQAMMRDKRYWHPRQRDPAYQRIVERGFELLYPTTRRDASVRMERTAPREGRLADLEAEHARLNGGAGGEIDVRAYHQDRDGEDVAVRAHTRGRPGSGTSRSETGGMKAEPVLYRPLQRRDGSPKPDLGGIGNTIRAQTGSDFAERLFENYWQGKGDWELSQADFDDIVKVARDSKTKKSITTVQSDDGKELERWDVDFRNSQKYNYALGSGAQIFFDKSGSPVGFSDTYNFDPKPWFQDDARTPKHEIITRSVDLFGRAHAAKAFKITFGKKPK